MSKVRNFKLGTILSVTTGCNLTKKGKFGEVEDLFWWVFDDDLIPTTGMGMLKDEMKEHLLTIHPELKDVVYKKGSDVDKFVLKQEKKFGRVLPISRMGEELPEEARHR